MSLSKPSWQLPTGVSRGTWDYVTSQQIASEYDDYVRGNPLLDLDLEFCLRLVAELRAADKPDRGCGEQPEVVVGDLGCGTGRVAEALLPLGCRMLNVDLSQAMLDQLARKIPAEYQANHECLHASLVDLDSVLQPASLDLAVCLFSSLGMIRGQQHRRRCLAGARQALKPGCKLLLHVHNRYRSLIDPGGLSWLIRTFLSSLGNSQVELGDRVYAYRGLPKMFLHIYSRRELLNDLHSAGFEHTQIYYVADKGDAILPSSTLFPGLRAGGFLAVATASGGR